MSEPKDLNEIVDLLIQEINKQKATEFVMEKGIPHHGAGTSIRNKYHLWWSEELRDKVYEKESDSDYPKEKPALVQWFNERDAYHADDISGIISEAVQAKLRGEEYDMSPTVERYKKHWKKQGFKNGIPKPENKQ